MGFFGPRVEDAVELCLTRCPFSLGDDAHTDLFTGGRVAVASVEELRQLIAQRTIN